MATNNSTNNWSPLTTKGDLFTYDTAPNRLAIGSNYYYPMADSTQSLGLSYQPPIPANEIFTFANIDFFASQNGDNLCTTTNTGTGSSAGIVNSIDNAHFGVMKLDMGTTTTGRATVIQNAGPVLSFLLGASTVTIETCINLNTLSNGTDTYTLFFGTTNNTSSITPTDGVYITYNSGTNSGNWVLTSRVSSVSTTSNASSGPSAATWVKLRLVITNTTGVIAYAATAGSDFTQIASISATLTSAGLIPWCVNLLKSAGTTDTFGYVDYVQCKVAYSSLR